MHKHFYHTLCKKSNKHLPYFHNSKMVNIKYTALKCVSALEEPSDCMAMTMKYQLCDTR